MIHEDVEGGSTCSRVPHVKVVYSLCVGVHVAPDGVDLLGYLACVRSVFFEKKVLEEMGDADCSGVSSRTGAHPDADAQRGHLGIDSVTSLMRC